MEFWGIEVKPGKSVKCAPREAARFLHLSQASLGESKGKANDNVPIFVKANGKKLALGTLSLEKCAQIQFDLVFEKEFELSHTSKNASVYFCGYHVVRNDNSESSDDDDTSESDSEPEEVPASQNAKGKSVANAVEENNSIAKRAKKAEPVKADKAEADEDDDSDSTDDMLAKMNDDSDEDEESSEDEEESSEEDEETTPEKVKEPSPKKTSAGKRPAESATKTPVPEKKAKVITPPGQKTGGDGKKGVVHVATPYPKKHAAKTPAVNNEKPKQQQTPKSAGSVTCKSCERTFKSESGLKDHTKAKHG